MNYDIKKARFDFFKSFLTKKNKLYIFIIINITIIIVFVVIYFYMNKNNKIEQKVKEFENIISQLDNNSKDASIYAKNFVSTSKDIYGVIINIKLAKLAVEQNDIILAEHILLNTLTITDSNNIRNLINIKLARIRLFLNKLDLALNNLNQINDKAWISIVENIKGDIYLRKGDIIAARMAYSKGMELDGTEIVKEILKLKINSLPN